MILDHAVSGTWQSTHAVHSLLTSAPEVYPAEPDLAFTGRVLLGRMAELLGALERAAEAQSLSLPDGAAFLARFEGGEGAAVLRDLRRAAVLVRGSEIDWMVLRQGSLAARQTQLADVSAIGIDEMRMVGRWLNTRINETSPQIVMTR